MNISDAFSDSRVLSGETWCRPVGARGYAYAVKDLRVAMVPTPSGGSTLLTFIAEEIAGPWELVDPRDVLAERAPPW